VGHYGTEKIVAEYLRLVQKWKCRRGAIETIGFQQLLRPPILKALRDAKIECGIVDYKPHGNKLKRIEHQLSQYFTTDKVLFATDLKAMGHVMNTFHFFGRSSVRDDPPDAFSVVIEHSHHPTKQHITVRKMGPASEARYALSQPTYNARYGGIY
jgi:hypothetical protein